MRLILAVWVAKLLTIIGKLAHKKSSSLPGDMALKICPDLIRKLSLNIKKHIIVTCGTNGKTTTNNLLCQALTATGHSVVCNKVGANMLGGVATVFAQSCNVLGRFTADYACLEVDEASAIKVFEHFKPSYIVITNIFRDQLDRYGEIDTTTQLLHSAIEKVNPVHLVLNGDDPLTVQFARTQKNATYFGVAEQTLDSKGQTNDTKDGSFCIKCGGKMEYEFFHYSQLGDFYCPDCGFKRPKLDFAASNVKLYPTLDFFVGKQKINLKSRGFYNIYNALAVYSIMSLLGLKVEDFGKIALDYKPQIGRMEQFSLNKPVILNLAKNPAGFNQAITTVLEDKRKKDVIIAINDNAPDGTDVSWIWDVDFENLADENLNSLDVTGIRVYDIALRFKYSGVDSDYSINDMRKSILKSLKSQAEVCYVLVNYTALFKTHDILSGLAKGGNYE